jgi:NTP pyrophosphatase (non-canonical NTP hydrolase)
MQNDRETTIEQLREKVREFVHAREWEKYHNPKDLAEAICIEAAELLERFQWRTPEEIRTWKKDTEKLEPIKEEIADVLIYCLSFANAMDIDLSEAILRKIRSNEEKYPVSKFRGKAHTS